MLTIQKAALTIDADGLHYGSLKLAKSRGRVLSARPAATARLVRPEQAAAVDKAIADWNRGDQTSALIRLVHPGVPELGLAIPSPGWLRHCEVVRMAKAGFDPNQPRDEDGKWTDEGGSGGDGSTTAVASPPSANEAITITPTGTSDAGSGNNGSYINDGVYHTTIGPDGKPVLPAPTPAQADLPPEEESTGEDGKEEEREDIFGVTSEGERFVSAYNALKQLDPDNEALQVKYLPADISSGAAADDLEAGLSQAAEQRTISYLMPNGQRIGVAGKNSGIRERLGGMAQAQADFDYLSVGATDITPPGFNGKRIALPGNIGTIGLRYKSTSDGSPALDVNVPGVLFGRIHYYD
jgi:hypothetical protein